MFWKLYFYFLTISYVIILVQDIYIGRLDFIVALDFFLSIIGLVAVYGYAYKKRFLNPSFWKMYFPIIITWDMLYGIVVSYQELARFNLIVNVITISLILLILMPLYIALFRYAYSD